MNKNLPPQNIEAEESYLSSILVNDKILDNCILSPDDFYQTLNQTIFREMKALHIKRTRVDLVTVGTALKNDKSCFEHLVRMVDYAQISSSGKAYQKIIKDNAVKRKLLNSVSAIQEKIHGSFDLDTLVDYAQSEIMKYTISEHDNKIYHIKDLLIEHMDEIEKQNTTEQVDGMKLGFKSLDRVLNIHGPNYAVIAGRPSMGKTAFALSIIRNMAMNSEKPGIISLEMGKGKLLDRWLSMLTGINAMNFHRFNALSQQDLQNLHDAMSEMYDLWDVLISDAPATSIETLERQARQMVSKGANVLFIDQLSHVRGQSDDDFRNFTKHSQRIGQLKKELDIPIFLLAQLNRKVEDRNDKEPKLSDLKMSGSLEEDADIVFLLYRPEYYEKSKEDKAAVAKDVVVNIAKNRDGATYRESDVIIFDKGRTIFEEDFSRAQKY
jgi:replicative DNA helicase